VARASEEIRAVAAPADVAKALGIPAGSPVLSITRIAYAVDGQPLEWRHSLCRSDTHHYALDLK